MPTEPSLEDWLSGMSAGERVVVLKRLSANDSGQTGGHQAGFYMPLATAFSISPELQEHRLNPKRTFTFDLVSHSQTSSPSLTYYNNRLFGGTRNECRVTGFGGQDSALQRPGNTGGLLCAVFHPTGSEVSAWLARDPEEEDQLESAFGPVLPGVVVWLVADGVAPRLHQSRLRVADVCRPDPSELPPDWLEVFPSGRALSAEAARRAAAEDLDPDTRLLRRFRCEYELFRVVEEVHLLPRVREFASVEEFLAEAQSALQRRKARAGRSLELHLARVFEEEGVACEWGGVTEAGKRPDALFPSVSRYREAPVGAADMHMLGVKTTLKDRWRQILEEADKIPNKHLFTLAEGVSVQQFEQIQSAGVTLVVPRENVQSFPPGVRAYLLNLAGFIQLVRSAQTNEAGGRASDTGGRESDVP